MICRFGRCWRPRLSDIELVLLDKKAEILGVSRSECLRKLLMENEIVHRVEVVADMEELRRLVGEYGKIGVNLNQIARYFNTGGERSLAMEDEIRHILLSCIRHRRDSRKKEMSVLRMSKKRNLELSFFLNVGGRGAHNETCRKCIGECKQSFRQLLFVALVMNPNGTADRRSDRNRMMDVKNRDQMEYMTDQTQLPAYLPYPRFLLDMNVTQTARVFYALLLD